MNENPKCKNKFVLRSNTQFLKISMTSDYLLKQFESVEIYGV